MVSDPRIRLLKSISRYDAMPSGGTSSAAQTNCATSLPGMKTANVTDTRNGSRLKNTRAERPKTRGAESNGCRNSRCIPKDHYMMGEDAAHDPYPVAGRQPRPGRLPLETGGEALSDAA